MSLLALQLDFMKWLRAEDRHFAERIGGGPGTDIYLNNHRASLMASIDGSYPMLRRWMGDLAFERAAAHHVETVHPAGWTLDVYGANLAETLKRLAPHDAAAHELARLEWALGQAFVAADIPPLRLDHLEQVAWDDAVLRLVPSARLLMLRTNADDILTTLLEDSEPPPEARHASTTAIVVWCCDFTPRFRRLAPEELWLVEPMASGVRFQDICTSLAQIHGEEEAIHLAGTYLAGWAAGGLCAHPAAAMPWAL